MTLTRYSRVAVAFHWIIAALILLNLGLGWRMGFLKGLAQFDMFQLHKSVGLTVLLLSLLRLGWRLLKPPPPPSPSVKPWERALSVAVHAGFYGFMIVMPLSGWIVVSTSPLNIPTLLYHLVPWPHAPWVHQLPAPERAGVNAAAVKTHIVLAFGALTLLALHIGGVLKHHLIDGDPVLHRMSPFGARA